MPAVSERQRKAMCAAAGGNSTLGISRSVGREFCGAKDAPPRYADRRWDAPPAKDMSRLDWRGLIHGLVKFFREEMAEPAHAARDAEFEEEKHPRNHGKFSAVAYHGSKLHNLSVVNSNIDNRQFDNATSQFGAFFAPDKEGAQKYAGEGGKIYEKELGLENAYMMPWKEFNYFQSPNRSKEDADGFTKPIDADGWTARGDELKQEAVARRKELEAKGHDGIVIRRPNGEVFEIASFKDVSLARDTQLALITAPNSAAPPPARRRADDADPAPRRAASVLILDPAGRVLLVRRAATEENWPDTWAFPGGKVDPGETTEEAARRETEEEVGYAPEGQLPELETKRTPFGWDHTTYLHRAAEAFEPKLNGEHSESNWFEYGKWPAQLHPGVAATLEGLPEDPADLLANEDEIGEDIDLKRNPDGSLQPTVNLGELLPRTTRELRRTGTPLGGHPGPRYNGGEAADMALSLPWCDRRWDGRVGVANDMALDSEKMVDVDGRLHVSDAPLTKACISEYLGAEIPDGTEKFGLDPNKRYKLFRAPDELEKAVDSFNRIPVLSRHQPVNADNHPEELVIGTTGSEAFWDPPYIRNSITFWTRDAIDRIESGKARQISAAYRYVYDPTPGEYLGEKYSGIMRGIIANHCAAVQSGRVGPDVAIDSLPIQEQEWVALERALLHLA